MLFAKTALLALIGAVVGLLAAFGAFYLAKLLATDPPVPLELTTADDWRQVAGYGALFAIAGVIAVAVGAHCYIFGAVLGRRRPPAPPTTTPPPKAPAPAADNQPA